MPTIMTEMPPSTLMITMLSSMKESTTVSENKATVAKSVSAEAAPRPDTNPERWLLLSVRWMHITPIGPNGMEARSPITIPFKKTSKPINHAFSRRFRSCGREIFHAKVINIIYLCRTEKAKRWENVFFVCCSAWRCFRSRGSGELP